MRQRVLFGLLLAAIAAALMAVPARAADIVIINNDGPGEGFNDPSTPFNFLYGTLAIMVISTVFHYYTVPFLTATTALKQLDPEFESIGESLETPFYRTFWRVTIPMTLPAIISIAMYFFLNAMVTISALVFLFVPGREVASLAAMLLDDAGESAQAMALSLLILVTGLAARGLFALLTRGIERRTQAWTQR